MTPGSTRIPTPLFALALGVVGGLVITFVRMRYRPFIYFQFQEGGGRMSGSMGKWTRGDWASLAGLVAGFLATRIAWIASLPRSSQYWEESYRWLAVEQLAGGIAIPLLDYQADHYQGGSLVLIMLAAALRNLGMDSFVAIKCVALAFSCATLVAVYAIARGLFDRTAGVLAGLIYLLGPPLVAFWGVVAMGFHAESSLLSLLGIGVFLRLARSARSERAWLWIAFGAVWGVAIWFAPIAALGLAACVISWPLVARRSPGAAEIALALCGIGIGLVPWFAYNLSRDFAGFMRVLEVFGIVESSDPWRPQPLLERIIQLVVRVPTEGLLDPGGTGRDSPITRLLFVGVWLPAGWALVSSLRRAAREHREEVVFLVHAAVFAVVLLASRFTLDAESTPSDFRLFVPAAVLLIPPLALSAARAIHTDAPRRKLGVAATSIALVCLGTSTALFGLRHQEEGTPLSLRGGYVTWGRLVQQKHGEDLGSAIAAVAHLPDEHRNLVLGGIGWGIEAAALQGAGEDRLRRALETLPWSDRDAVSAGARWAIGSQRRTLASATDRDDALERARTTTRLDSLAKATRTRSSVVVVTLDTTRVDHLSAYGYERKTTPSLDAFAASAVRYRRAWSTSSWTLPAHASLFTGLYPSRHGARYDSHGELALSEVLRMPAAEFVRAGKLVDGATTLAEILAERGYRTGAFVAGPWLARVFGLLQGFEHKDDAVSSFNGRSAREITQGALAWLRSVEPGQPYFLFANYFDPHAPYEKSTRYPDLPLAREPLVYDYAKIMRGEEVIDEATGAVLRDRYDAEIRDMDRQLGRLLDAVMSRADSEQTLVIVTADHGEALGEEGRFGHGFWLTEEMLRVPFIVRYPFDRDAGTWSDAPVQLVDVLPLVAQELDVPLPEGVEGVLPGARDSVFAELYREASTVSRFGELYDRDLKATILWPHKLVRSDDGHEELLLIDPTRLRSEADPQTASAGELSEALEAYSKAAPAADLVAPSTDEETVRALRELGYVE